MNANESRLPGNLVPPPDGDQPQICPRCHRQRVVWLRSMARHSALDWFKCDGCEHTFTRPRPSDDNGAADEGTTTEVAS